MSHFLCHIMFSDWLRLSFHDPRQYSDVHVTTVNFLQNPHNTPHSSSVRGSYGECFVSTVSYLVYVWVTSALYGISCYIWLFHYDTWLYVYRKCTLCVCLLTVEDYDIYIQCWTTMAAHDRWYLTHLPWDKMATISQTTFSNAFSWMKSFVFQVNFHWNLFLRVQLTISQHWFW